MKRFTIVAIACSALALAGFGCGKKKTEPGQAAKPVGTATLQAEPAESAGVAAEPLAHENEAERVGPESETEPGSEVADDGDETDDDETHGDETQDNDNTE